MPLEIRELHVKVTVTEPANAPAPSSAGSGGGQAALVKKVVEQVLQILERKKQR